MKRVFKIFNLFDVSKRKKSENVFTPILSC